MSEPRTIPHPMAPPRTGTATLWVWLLIAATALSGVSAFPALSASSDYVLNSFDLVTSDPTIVQSDQYIELILNSLISTLALLTVSSILAWAMWGLSIWCGVLDSRDLSARGISRPFHWAWAILSPLIYVIGRHVVITRRGGRGAAPLVAMIVIQVLVFVITLVWAVFVNVQIASELIRFMTDALPTR